MINTQELRIGNYIKIPFFNNFEVDEEKNYQPVAVNWMMLRDADNYKSNWAAKPIHITEEWLLKFGFEKEESCGFKTKKLKKYTFSINANELIIYIGNMIIIKIIQYVHELQNLIFALTGEELILK